VGGEVVMLARALPEIPDHDDLSIELKLAGWRAITEINTKERAGDSPPGTPARAVLPRAG
jgi:hypothetical protein